MGNACISAEETTDDGKVTYAIETKTSNAYRGAGTDATVYVDLVGDGGDSTGWVKLDTSFFDDFERGSNNVYKRRLDNVGLPVAIRLKLSNKLTVDEWRCDHVTVSLGGRKVEFVVDDWVEETVVEVSKEASLLHKLPDSKCGDILRAMRTDEVKINRSRIQWMATGSPDDAAWGLPRSVNATAISDLPLILQREWSKVNEQARNERRSLAHRISSKVLTAFKPLQDLDDYWQLQDFGEESQAEKKSELLQDLSWQDDEVMGYQMLNGACPLAISRCEVIPNNFNVTEDDVISLLRPGKSLEEELRAGRCYIADFSHLEDVERQQGKFCCNSIGLFYTNIKNLLVPIAIQLVPGDRDYLFTSADNGNDWLLAKMHFKCAFANMHQWVDRYLHTHAVMEPFALALFRSLPRAHPIFKLLRPHLWTVAAANVAARNLLLEDESPGTQAFALSPLPLLRRVYKTFGMHDLNVPKVLQAKGLDDPLKLSGFYYREDAVRLWQCIEEFVQNVVSHVYDADEDVSGDEELQNWAHDVVHEGLAWADGDAKGMPDKITTTEKLHSAVNTDQMGMYRFVPSCPGAMRLPPHKKGEGTLELIMNSLPDVDMSLAMMTVISVTTGDKKCKVLRNVPKYFRGDNKLVKMQEQFTEKIKWCEETTKRRNKNNRQPYTCLRPSRIPINMSL